MNYKESCITCLGKTKEMRHITSYIFIGGAGVCLLDILKNFYNFQEPPKNPFYPENLCINCVHQLTLTYSFKNLIESSLNTLENAIIDSVDNDSEYDLDDEHKPDVTEKIKKNNMQFRSKAYNNKSLKRKRIRRKKENETRLFCVECQAEFQTATSLKEHCTNNHLVKSNTGRECEYCNEKIEEFKDLVIHRKLHMRPYLCETCWAGFFTEEEIKTHMCQPIKKKDHSDKELCQCDQCGKSYPRGYIKVHMMTHGNDLKYSCKYCPKKFKVANGLNSHVLWNHKRTRDHKCEECGATFISASARCAHVRKNHLKEKKYGCESCEKRFFSKSELQRHMLTHTGAKNFHCHLCDKSYQTRYGLNVHLKSHTNNMSVNLTL